MNFILNVLYSAAALQYCSTVNWASLQMATAQMAATDFPAASACRDERGMARLAIFH